MPKKPAHSASNDIHTAVYYNTVGDAGAAISAEEIYLNASKVRQRYGISDMALWRWIEDEKVAFPKPLGIGGRRYWRLSELNAFELSCVGKKARIGDTHVSKRRASERAAAKTVAGAS